MYTIGVGTTRQVKNVWWKMGNTPLPPRKQNSVARSGEYRGAWNLSRSVTNSVPVPTNTVVLR